MMAGGLAWRDSALKSIIERQANMKRLSRKAAALCLPWPRVPC
jgi:hypothetical protein